MVISSVKSWTLFFNFFFFLSLGLSLEAECQKQGGVYKVCETFEALVGMELAHGSKSEPSMEEIA